VVRIRLLGGVGAATDGGEPVDVGPAKCQAVLAALALSAGSAVPVWRLVELVWGEDPPRTADRTLQSYLTRLRKGLGPGSIVRTGAAYRLAVPADSVDAVRFQRFLDAGDAEAALAEWTGLPLAGLVVPGLAATVDGLVERWLSAVEADLGARVETDPPAAIGALTELTATHPFREGLWALLMTALYRAGRQSDALAAYRTVRQNLVEHLGIEPGTRLRELESLVLAHDERLAVARPAIGAGRPTGTVTFGFCEVADSGRWWATHREEMAAAMARLDEVVAVAVARRGGYVFATGGDSFGVAFHRATDAVSWATSMHAAMGGDPRSGDLDVRLRIGLHTGEAEERAQGYFGPAVNVAARLAAAGHGGQTLLSSGTATLLAGGIEGGELRDLGMYRLADVPAEQRIVQVGSGEHPPLRTEERSRGNLPRRPGRLIGREKVLETVEAALTAYPVVTLAGPGGIGKTRLAVAAARQTVVDDGAWLIDLAEIASSGEVPQAVAGRLGVKESAGRMLSRSIVAALRSRRALLVLDNCEHVIDGAAELVQAIADDCPDVRVLATSREALGLDHGHERVVAIAPLDPAGSGVELFNERASAVSATFDPYASRRDVEEICRRLDGVPLAIELAAARTTSLAPADLLDRLDDHLRLLTGGRRTGAERHQAMRATIQWSYDLLDPPEQLLFQRLSIFTGPFDLPAAETVAADAAHDIDDLLGNLVDRSMLVVESGPFGRRFRLLETMRQFAAEYLSATGHTGLIAERHARWCLDEVAHIHRLLTGPAEVEGVARLDELWPNHRAAFSWACSGDDRRLAYALVRPVVAEVVFRCRHEIGEWVERILTMTPPEDTELIIFCLTWAAQRYKLSQDPASYERLLDRHGEPDHPLIRHARASVHDDREAVAAWAPPSLAELRRRGDHDLAEQVELDVGAALLFGRRFQEGDALVTRLAGRYRAQGPPTLLNWSLMLLGYSASFQGEHERAEQVFDEALGVEVPERTHSPNKPVQARALFRRGDRLRAFRTLHSYVEELLDTDNTYAACVACVEFINMMARLDRLTDAASVLGYLETTSLLDASAWETQIAEARQKIAAQPGANQMGEHRLDDRQALHHMRRILGRLAEGPPIETMTNREPV